jgi:hypothetical protein
VGAATWFGQLQPAFDERELFFERSLRELAEDNWHPDLHNEPVSECIRASYAENGT